jgi:CBS domain containing-hemolysin-like protein
MKGALYINEGVLLEEALRRMQGSGRRMAIVLGLKQQEIGMISLQDILEVIFGEITL